jgi:hypothetical protein
VVGTSQLLRDCFKHLFGNIRKEKLNPGLHAINLRDDKARPYKKEDIRTILPEQDRIVMLHPPCSSKLITFIFFLVI